MALAPALTRSLTLTPYISYDSIIADNHYHALPQHHSQVHAVPWHYPINNEPTHVCSSKHPIQLRVFPPLPQFSLLLLSCFVVRHLRLTTVLPSGRGQISNAYILYHAPHTKVQYDRGTYHSTCLYPTSCSHHITELPSVYQRSNRTPFPHLTCFSSLMYIPFSCFSTTDVKVNYHRGIQQQSPYYRLM